MEPYPSIASTRRKRSRPGARRRGGEGARTIVLWCCYVAAAGGRFAAAFTGTPSPPLVPSSRSEAPAFQMVRTQNEKRWLACKLGGDFMNEAGSGQLLGPAVEEHHAFVVGCHGLVDVVC